MKRNVLWNIALVSAFLLMLAGEAYAVTAVIRLDMLPAIWPD